ncbi:MAG: hypothetical protein ACT4OX_15400 [Actinomycetota bacterium]
MLLRCIAITVTALTGIGLTACNGDDDETRPDASATTATTPGDDTTTSLPNSVPESDWDPGALVVAEGLAQDIRDGDVACDTYTVDDYALLAIDFANRIPIPLASTSCVGPGGEDFTFEVFADEVERENFVASKLQVICATVAEGGIDFPGLPTVEGPRWLIEPDEDGTAQLLADLVGGGFVLRTCPTATSST